MSCSFAGKHACTLQLCLYLTILDVVTKKRYCLVFWLDEELVSVVEEKNVMGKVIAGGENMQELLPS